MSTFVYEFAECKMLSNAGILLMKGDNSCLIGFHGVDHLII